MLFPVHVPVVRFFAFLSFCNFRGNPLAFPFELQIVVLPTSNLYYPTRILQGPLSTSCREAVGQAFHTRAGSSRASTPSEFSPAPAPGFVREGTKKWEDCGGARKGDREDVLTVMWWPPTFPRLSRLGHMPAPPPSDE